MVHNLSVLIPTAKDCKTQKVLDSSIYNPSYPVITALLEVTPPGYDCPVVFQTAANFNITLNCANLHILQATNEGHFANLPDGVYKLKYSIDPNIRANVEYKFLRVCKLQVLIREEMKKLYNDKSKVGKTLFMDGLDQLLYIDNTVKAATYFVEDDDVTRGMELYNEAYELLKDYRKCKHCKHV